MQILKLRGTDKQLYKLVAPLVMDPVVLKQNYNYPFRTSENFVWYVAVDKHLVMGFIPVECRRLEHVINNYYIKDRNKEVLSQLLANIITDTAADVLLTSVTFLEDHETFLEHGFTDEKVWTRYVKMKKES